MNKVDGVSLRTHYAKYQQQTGKVHKKADIEPIPQYLGWFIRTWQDMSAGKTVSGMGLTPLSWQDMLAWSTLRQVRLTPFDVETICMIDRVWLGVSSDAMEKERDTGDGST